MRERAKTGTYFCIVETGLFPCHYSPSLDGPYFTTQNGDTLGDLGRLQCRFPLGLDLTYSFLSLLL